MMWLARVLACFGLAVAAHAVELKPATVRAFDRYIQTAETRLDGRQDGQKHFLWVDEAAERLRQVRGGQVAVQPWTGKGEVEVPDGLIHDWVGAVFIPGTTLAKTLALVQDYDNHKNIYAEVIDSKLLHRDGNEFRVYLRLRKKKVVTVVMNTEHDVRYYRVDPARWRSRSYSTRIAEVVNAGEPDEHELPPGTGQGFLWRLYSYWRFAERDGGVYIECEAISLTRDVPTGLGWLIVPIIRGLPRESLVNTLAATRAALSN